MDPASRIKAVEFFSICVCPFLNRMDGGIWVQQVSGDGSRKTGCRCCRIADRLIKKCCF